MLCSARRSKASLCQEVGPVFLAAREVAFGRCGGAPERSLPAFLVVEFGRRLAAPPGRTSSLRCGRSTWICCFAGGDVAAIEERPAVPAVGAAAVGWGQ